MRRHGSVVCKWSERKRKNPGRLKAFRGPYREGSHRVAALALTLGSHLRARDAAHYYVRELSSASHGVHGIGVARHVNDLLQQFCT